MELSDFTPYNGVHCETNAIGTALAHLGWTLSEEMLFGLGEGLSYRHWTPEESGTPYPICSGRISAGQIGVNLARNCEFSLQIRETDSREEAWEHVLNALEAGQIPSVRCDIYHLPYFRARHHFGAHYIGVIACDRQNAYVTDTAGQGGVHRVTREELAIARDSREGYQPARNLSQSYHLPPERPDLPKLIPQAIRSCIHEYLHGTDPNCGPACINRTANWLRDLSSGSEASAIAASINLGNFWRFAGTGGANFRRLYRDFLQQSSEHCPRLDLGAGVAAYDRLVASWDVVIDLLLAVSTPHWKDTLGEVAGRLEAIAFEERVAASQLLQIV